jgi:hypothetical protein
MQIFISDIAGCRPVVLLLMAEQNFGSSIYLNVRYLNLSIYKRENGI